MSLMMAMNVQEMERVVSEITASRALEDPSGCISDLNQLLNATEGRTFLSKQEGEKALVLIELFDWALKSHGTGIPLKKGCILWTLRQLCACRETLPKSCVLPIEFKSSDPHHAAGGFADVWKGTHDGKEVAFKSIRGSSLSDDAARLKRKRRFCKEVVLWKSLNHPNILGLIGVCRLDNAPDARLTMVSEWMENGNIIEYIKHNDAQRMQLLVDCAKGVRYLHSVNLVHGDLKGANILISSDDPVRARLADFGFMTITYDGAGGPESTSALGGGTTLFMAPELLSPSMFGKTRCQVSKEADAYAFGMVILQVLGRLMPFYALRDTEVSYKVIQGERPTKPPNANEIGISDGLWQLLTRCWDADYTKRPLIGEIFEQLCQEPARGRIFPPSRHPQIPSYESILDSGTQKYADIFVTAAAQTPIEECAPFPMPMSPIDVTEHSSRETRNPPSLFSAETGDVSPITSPGDSHARTAESKLPTFETPSRTVSNGSDSATVAADPTDERATSGHALGAGVPLLRGPGPFKHAYDLNQHDPTIHDIQSPHVDLTEAPVPAHGTTHPLSPRSNLPRVKPPLARIVTSPPLEQGDSNNTVTAFFTPGASGEARHSQPFDSAMNIQIGYSESGSGSPDVVRPTRRVTGVRQLSSYRVMSPELSRRKRSGPRRETTPQKTTWPSQNTQGISNTKEQEGLGDSALNLSSFDEIRSAADPSKRIPEARTSATLGRGFESQRRSKLPRRDKRSDIKETMFPRPKGKRAVPRWNGGEGRSGGKPKEKGEARDDPSLLSADYVSVPSEVENQSRDRNLTPRSNPSILHQVLAKLGVRGPPRPLPLSNRALTQAEKNETTGPTRPATPASPTHTSGVDSGQNRDRALHVFPSFRGLRSGFAKMRNGDKRNVKAPS